MKRLSIVFAILMQIVWVGGCTGVPDGVTPVTGFDVERYLGRWYEIARLDHSFERGLDNVTAHYSLREDGAIKVLNRGFDVSENRWREAEGKALFIDDPHTGRLKVSFFGPFYGSYNIIELDKAGYRYAMVCGPDTSWLWILSRQPELDADIIRQLVTRAAQLGFDTENLIYVSHDRDVGGGQ